jgi:hypothetical protein
MCSTISSGARLMSSTIALEGSSSVAPITRMTIRLDYGIEAPVFSCQSLSPKLYSPAMNPLTSRLGWRVKRPAAGAQPRRHPSEQGRIRDDGAARGKGRCPGSSSEIARLERTRRLRRKLGKSAFGAAGSRAPTLIRSVALPASDSAHVRADHQFMNKDLHFLHI